MTKERRLAIAEVIIHPDDFHPESTQTHGEVRAFQVVRPFKSGRQALLGLPLMQIGRKYRINYPHALEYNSGKVVVIEGVLCADSAGQHLGFAKAAVTYEGQNPNEVEFIMLGLHRKMKIVPIVT